VSAISDLANAIKGSVKLDKVAKGRADKT